MSAGAAFVVGGLAAFVFAVALAGLVILHGRCAACTCEPGFFPDALDIDCPHHGLAA